MITRKIQINRLIPFAEKEANEKVRKSGKFFEMRNGVGDTEYKHCFFTEHFHKEMNRMAREEGLR